MLSYYDLDGELTWIKKPGISSPETHVKADFLVSPGLTRNQTPIQVHTEGLLNRLTFLIGHHEVDSKTS